MNAPSLYLQHPGIHLLPTLSLHNAAGRLEASATIMHVGFSLARSSVEMLPYREWRTVPTSWKLCAGHFLRPFPLLSCWLPGCSFRIPLSALPSLRYQHLTNFLLSSFTRGSPVITRGLPVVTYGSPVITHGSSVITRGSPVITLPGSPSFCYYTCQSPNGRFAVRT